MQDIRWFHSLELNGEVMPGVRPREILTREADLFFAQGVSGKSVLDIGAWDGFFSFEAERRGAARVLSTDHFCWSGSGWGTKAGYDHAHGVLGSKCESLDIDVFDLDPGQLGTFDVVLFLGVLYHLKDPLGGLEKAAAMTHDLLIVETVTDLNLEPRPALAFYPGGALDSDPTNFFAPNTIALEAMLNEIGFGRVEIAENAEPRPAPGGLASLVRSIKGKLAPVPQRTRHVAYARR